MKLNEELSRITKNHPDKAAFIYQDVETSYSELENRVKRFASGLEGLGLQKGDHIALIAWNSPLYVIALYSLLRMGAVVIPIKPVLTSIEMKYILRNGNVKAVITMGVFMDKLNDILEELPTIQHVIIDETEYKMIHTQNARTDTFKSFTKVIDGGNKDYPPPYIDENDTAMILYTSGTTGNPKGAVLSHKNIYANAELTADFLQYRENDFVISVLPMVHVFSLGTTLCSPLLKGGTLLIMPKFSPKEVFRLAKEYKATVFAGVPTMYNYLLQTVHSQPMFRTSFSTIRLCLSGGASISIALLSKFEKKFHVKITEGYGLTEAAPLMYNPVHLPPKPGSIGKTVPHVECKIIDEFGKEVRMGEVGELIVKGPQVMKGYYLKKAETNQTFTNGWLLTGDLVRRDENDYFYIVDRKKDVVIVKGYNVYPKEVEEILYTNTSIVEAAVVGVPHSEMGEAVIAFVVVNHPFISEEALIKFCENNLAKYKVPFRITLLDKLPKNATGKIDKKKLKAMSDNIETALVQS